MMTATTVTPMTRRQARHRRTRWGWQNALIFLAVIAGFAVLLYPTTANWFSDREHATAISGYVDAVRDASPTELGRVIAAARDYNERLPQGPLRDPYLLNAEGRPVDVNAARQDYLDQLGDQPNAPVARLRIPKIDVDLPIYHGTEDAVLERGIGHLYGSSLPVGGLGQHSVLTGHAGLPSARLLSDLDDLVLGDEFMISVSGEDLWYRVASIETVLPDESESLSRVPGRDSITLITCTPTGINTHRLLVRGDRIDAPIRAADERLTLPSNAEDPGFPWWVIAAAAAFPIAWFVARPARPRTARARAIEHDTMAG